MLKRCSRGLVVAATCGILGVLMLWLARPAAAQTQAVPVPVAPPSALAGAPIYAQNCAPCHGNTGNSDGPTAASLPMPPAQFADASAMWAMSPSAMFSVTHNGRIAALMPPWGNQLSDLEIWNAVAFAWSLHTDSREVDAGQRLYTATCAECHGAGGSGDGPAAAAPMASFGDQAWAIQQSQADLRSGWLAAHQAIGDDLPPDQQRALLAYIRTFSLASPWGNPYVPGEGSIGAIVEQGTQAGSSVVGLPVTLDAWLGDARVATLTSTVDAGGAFTFTNLSTDPSLVYIASVASQGVSYSSNLIALAPLTPTVSGRIVVFDTTSDPSVLRLDRVNWIVETEPLSLTVGMIYAFGNMSDRTYVGERSDPESAAPTIAMQIPANAANLSFENGIVGGRFLQEGANIRDTLPVAPGAGTRQIILRYDIPHAGGTAEIAQTFLYTTSELNLFVGDRTGLSVVAPALTSQGVREIGASTPYQLFVADQLAPQTVTLAIEGLPDGSLAAPPDASTAPAPSVPTTPLLPVWTGWLVAILVAVTLAGGVMWALAHGRSDEEEVAQESSAQRAQVIAQIALLDDLHAAGSLTEAHWRAERTRLLQQLAPPPMP